MVILRLNRPTHLLTAAVFEELFSAQLGSAFTVRYAETTAWSRAVLGPCGSPWSLDGAAAALESALDDADFLAPNYEAALLAPLFLALRNHAGLRTRLLLVAHAPGAWATEWALMARLLAPGDLIVAPSRNAADLISFLDPDLAPFVTVVPHPMEPLDSGTVATADPAERIVSLGRIHPGKLLHRQIEALEILRRRGRRVPALDIAGAAETTEARSYLLSLQAKVRRLGLEASVRFVGAIQGRRAKAEFLSGAKVLVNLSVTIEESFGKAPIEALGSGIPVLATRWDGLPEAVGECGVLLPIECRPGVSADVAAESVADGLQRLLYGPPSAAACRRQAECFAPSAVLPRYRAALEGAQAARGAASNRCPQPPRDADRAAPERGVLAMAAPLTAMSWRDAFSAYLDCCDDLRRSWETDAAEPRVRLNGILLQGTRAPVEAFLGGRTSSVETPVPSPVDSVVAGTLVDQVAAAAQRPAAPSTRVACLVYLWQAGCADQLRSGLESLDFETPAVLAMRAEEACMAGDLDLAFDRAGRLLDLTSDDSATVFRLRQLARIARAAGAPERALPSLAEWLDRFPDSPDSGQLWLDRCLNASSSGNGVHASEAVTALGQARVLLGDSPLLERVERLVVCAQATAAVSD